MAPVEITEDYYAVLRISQTATPPEIRKSYLLLAKTEHPDKNSGNPTASDAFVLIQTAYETLKDPAKRREYDLIWPRIAASVQAKGAAVERKRAEEHRAAERERNRAEAQKANLRKQAEERKQEEEAEMKRKAESAKQHQRKAETHHQPKPATRTYVHLSKLSVEKLRDRGAYIERETFELTRQIRRLEGEMKRLDAQDSSKSGTTWDSNSTSYFYSSTSSNDTDEAKMEEERKRLQRGVAKRVKETELQSMKTKLEELKSEMQAINERIGAARKPPGQSTRSTEWQQKQDEIRKKAQEQRRQEEQKKKSEEQQRQEQEKRNLQEQQRQEEQRKKVQEQQKEEELRFKQDQQWKKEEQQKQEWFKNFMANREQEYLKEQAEERQQQEREWAQRELEEQVRRLSVHQPQASTIPNLGRRATFPQPQQNFNPYNPQLPQPQNNLNSFNYQTPEGISAFRNLNGRTSYPQPQPPVFPQPQPQPQVFAQPSPAPARTIPLCPGTIDENSTAFEAISKDGSMLRFPCWVFYAENDRVQCWRCGLVVCALDILQMPHRMPQSQQYKLPITIVQTAIPYPDPSSSTGFGSMESRPANARATPYFWPGWQPQL